MICWENVSMAGITTERLLRQERLQALLEERRLLGDGSGSANVRGRGAKQVGVHRHMQWVSTLPIMAACHSLLQRNQQGCKEEASAFRQDARRIPDDDRCVTQTAREDAAATILELEAKRLEVTKRRHQLQLSQMVSFEMERKQTQVRHGDVEPICAHQDLRTRST